MPYYRRRAYSSRRASYRFKRRSKARGSMRKSYYSKRRVGRRVSNQMGTRGSGNVLHYFPIGSKAFLPGIIYNKMYTSIPIVVNRTLTANTVSELFFLRANDMLSMIQVGAVEKGVRPLGLNEMQTLYDNWQVLACSIDFECYQNSTAEESNPIVVCGVFKESTFNATSQQAALEEKYSKSIVINPWISQAKSVHLRMYAKIANVIGTPINQLSTTFGKDLSDSPTKRVNCIFSGFSADNTDTVVSLSGLLKVTYWVKWWKPDLVDTSSTSGFQNTVAFT